MAPSEIQKAIEEKEKASKTIPGVTFPAPEPPPGEELFDRVWGAATNSTQDLEIPSSLNKLWSIAMNGSMYTPICFTQ